MKTKQILMTGALALSMVLSGGMLTGCSNSSTKDTKTTEVTKKKEVKTIGQKNQGFKIFEDYKQHWKENHCVRNKIKFRRKLQ